MSDYVDFDKTKLCGNCRHFSGDQSYRTCQSGVTTTEFDVAWGERKKVVYFSVDKMRADGGECGPSGRLFEQKEESTKQSWRDWFFS